MVTVEAIKNALGHETGLKIQLGNAVAYWEYGPVLKVGTTYPLAHSYNPFAFRKALAETMTILGKNWIPTGKCANIPKTKARLWVIKKFQKLVNYLVYPHWQKMITKLDGQHLLLAKTLFMADISTNGSGGRDILSGDIVFEPYQLREIRNHKAAAMLAINRHTEFMKLSDWRIYYALNGEITPALRETIDNFMSAIPFYVLKRLSHVSVEKPLRKKIEIVSSIASYYPQRRVVHHSEHKALKIALKTMECSKLQSTNAIYMSVSDMTNYVDKVNDVVELAKKKKALPTTAFSKSHDWWSPTENNPYLLDENEILFSPPIAPPDIIGIKPIKTAGDIWNIVDNNLVPGFTHKEGKALLTDNDDVAFPFLVEQDSYKTIAVVHSDGYIQADGGTPADEYAKFYLQNWADDLSEEDFAV